jgi:hypothetical protein
MKTISGNVRKWLTALMLSPGMIFTLAYLLVWLSTNLYLDNTFKSNLKRSFTSDAGVQYKLVVGSLRSRPDLNTLTLKRLELIPISNGKNDRTNGPNLQIEELQVPCPDLCLFPFRPSEATVSAHHISREILSQCKSMNRQTGSLPSYRADLVDRIGQDRQVRIP